MIRVPCRVLSILSNIIKPKSIIIDNKNCRAIIKLPYTQNKCYSNGMF